MTNLRKTMICLLAVLTLGVGGAATAPSKWGQGFGAAAAASATAAATESGVCALSNACP